MLYLLLLFDRVCKLNTGDPLNPAEWRDRIHVADPIWLEHKALTRMMDSVLLDFLHYLLSNHIFGFYSMTQLYLLKKFFLLSSILNAGPPTCHSLEFVGSMVEGQRLSFVASYSGGYCILNNSFCNNVVFH